ncbi:MAG: AEC family transporter [Synergistaceae bacterium]|jgi:predicted permease|nr:AEC family transporter [Synergistaceae bacterium]
MQSVLVVLPIFLIVAMGWILRYKKVISPQTLRENNSVLYWFAMPCVILRGILGADLNVLQNPSFVAAVWLPYLATTTVVWIFGRHGETRERFSTLTLSATRGNHFFAGLPIIYLAMGQPGVEAATLNLAISLVAMQLVSIGSGQLALFGKPSWTTMLATMKHLLKNPLFMFCLLGLLMDTAGLNHLPKWMDSTLSILADISTGMALLMLGAGLHIENVLKMIQSVWKILFVKLVLHPVLGASIFLFFGLSSPMFQASVLLTAMPVGINTAIIAEEMGMDGEYCGRGVALTTLCSMISLPLWINILGLV